MMSSIKTCSKCGESKPVDDFQPRKTSKDGRRCACRECENKRKLEWHHMKMNDDQYRATRRNNQIKYREDNPGMSARMAREWGAKNRELVRERCKLYYVRNRETIIERQSKYHPNKTRAKNQAAKYRKDGFELHHWSYNECHFEDVIQLSIIEHSRIHQWMVFDEDTLLFRKKTDNELLKTKQDHMEYMEFVLSEKYKLINN